ncbi:radical SAM family heme chaperone HemW [Hyphobacterium marinum]|uniref:Heme chaperone HemW n=1 Tax=Hyphobacterium marinum TaxID=3116574 RepID=A0ABU7LV40_9PROT|nr:radical SAM family heme chaperone HemW [Hyphobacterium sp. Y6023]MEE2565417.1 radical SAM family heme chaperone HemW [Hyphobacterium sp. Y6023]
MTPSLGLYLHWPYCARICPYCDFNVYKSRASHDDLVDAILADMGHWRELTGKRPLASIHFGGGTPSLLKPAQLEHLIARAEDLWGLEAGIEIGLEANPDDQAAFAGLAAAGANRLSLGVQSFDDAALKALGRAHDGDGARAAIKAAQAAFPRVSFDMIYALEGQGLDDWRGELSEAIDYGTEHLSLYQLTIEPGTAFAKRVERGALIPPGEDLAADLYALTQELCAKAGLEAYEISNHARGVSAQSVHNRLYWTGGDWIGVGPGAHGRLGSASGGGRLATEARARPEAYRAGVTETGRGHGAPEILSADAEAAERILMGLRITDGLDRAALRAATGRDIDIGAAERYARQGLLTLTPDRVALTPEARVYGDRMANELVPD